MRNLKAYRAKFGVTQKDMASFLGVSVLAYRNKENGVSRFALDEAKKIAEKFHAPIEDIFFDKNVYEKETLSSMDSHTQEK